MALSIVTGHCYAAWWAQIGNAAPVPEAHVALLGIRDLSPDAERERVERSRMLRVAWVDGQPDGDIDATVATLGDRVERVYRTSTSTRWTRRSGGATHATALHVLGRIADRYAA